MNRLTSQVLNKFHNVEDQRVIDFIDAVTNDVRDKKIAVTEYLKTILSMLVVQLTLYFKAVDQIYDAEKVSSKDVYDRKSKAPEISVLNKAHDKILELMDKISLSPLAEAKVKKLNKDDDADAKDLLDDLIN